jgi:hypothetical protein
MSLGVIVLDCTMRGVGAHSRTISKVYEHLLHYEAHSSTSAAARHPTGHVGRFCSIKAFSLLVSECVGRRHATGSRLITLNSPIWLSHGSVSSINQYMIYSDTFNPTHQARDCSHGSGPPRSACTDTLSPAASDTKDPQSTCGGVSIHATHPTCLHAGLLSAMTHGRPAVGGATGRAATSGTACSTAARGEGSTVADLHRRERGLGAWYSCAAKTAEGRGARVLGGSERCIIGT